MMVEKATDLTALIAGIRSHRGKEDEYIGSSLRAIRRELQTGTRGDKSEAVLKLWYLSLLGYDTASWSAFAIVEVMSTSSLVLKRPGFFACATSFHDDTSVALLTINLFKKELCQTGDVQSACLALSTMAAMATPDIARDLYSDVFSLLSASKPQIRRRACLCLLRLLMKYPPGLLSCYAKMKELLTDSDVSVVSAAVSVILELAIRNPKNYVRLAPVLHKLLASRSSNWLWLKVLKLFRLLCPLEPRLPPKLHAALLDILQDESTARSVELEVLRLVLSCFPPTLDMTKMAVERVKKRFVASTDVNLQCIGLNLLTEAAEVSDAVLSLIRTSFGDELLTEILKFVSSPDSLIRSGALRLMQHALSQTNFMAAAESLLARSRNAPTSEAAEYVLALLRFGERDSFSLIEDFQAYVTILVTVSRQSLPPPTYQKLSNQFMELAKSVPSLRPFLLRAVAVLLFPEFQSSCSSESLPAFSLPPPPPTQPRPVYPELTSALDTVLGPSPQQPQQEVTISHTQESPPTQVQDQCRYAAHPSEKRLLFDEDFVSGHPLSTEESTVTTLTGSAIPSASLNETMATTASTVLPTPPDHHRAQHAASMPSVNPQQQPSFEISGADWVDLEILKTVAQLIGSYASVLFHPFTDLEDVRVLSRLYVSAFRKSRQIPNAITLLSAALPYDPSASTVFPTFVVLVAQQLLITALATDLDAHIRSHVTLSAIRLLELLEPFGAEAVGTLLAQLMAVEQSFSSSGITQLNILGRLFSCLSARRGSESTSVHSSMMSSMSILRQRREESPGIEVRVAPPDDLHIPFFDVAEGLMAPIVIPGSSPGVSGIRSILPEGGTTSAAATTLVEVNTQATAFTTRMKKHIMVPSSTDERAAGSTLVQRQREEQLAAASLRLWEPVINDGCLAVYASLSGREEVFGLEDRCEHRRSHLSKRTSAAVCHVVVDFRCENLMRGKVLKNVRLWQLFPSTPVDGDGSFETLFPEPSVLLSSSLRQRSRKVHMVLVASQELIVCRSHFVEIQVSYEVHEASIADKEDQLHTHRDIPPLSARDAPASSSSSSASSASSSASSVSVREASDASSSVVAPPLLRSCQGRIMLPISLVIQPLPLEYETATAMLMTTPPQSFDAKATLTRTYPLDDIPSLRLCSSLDQLMESLVLRLMRASALCHFHLVISTRDDTVLARPQPAASTLDPCVAPSLASPHHRTMDLNAAAGEETLRVHSHNASPSTTTTDHHQQPLQSAIHRLNLLLVGRLWNPDIEALAGLGDFKGKAGGGKRGDGPEILVVGMILGFLSLTVHYSSFPLSSSTHAKNGDGSLQLAFTFLSSDSQTSSNCVSAFLFFVDECLVGRLAMP